MTPEPESNGARDLPWVEEVAALLPEESRLGWYQNVRPWLRMLPPDDEIAHLAYSMGYLALLTRNTPSIMAAERAKMAALVQRLSEEMTRTLKTTADYHQKLDDRLNKLPAEIAQGLSPEALAAEIVAGAKEQFLQSGLPEAGRLLKEQGDRLGRILEENARAIADVRKQVVELKNHATYALDHVASCADTTKKSIDRWGGDMPRVEWLNLAYSFAGGFVLCMFLSLWLLVPKRVVGPEPVAAPQQLPPAIQKRAPKRH
jgi:hypothetical protein